MLKGEQKGLPAATRYIVLRLLAKLMWRQRHVLLSMEAVPTLPVVLPIFLCTSVADLERAGRKSHVAFIYTRRGAEKKTLTIFLFTYLIRTPVVVLFCSAAIFPTFSHLFFSLPPFQPALFAHGSPSSMTRFGDFQPLCSSTPSYPWCNLFYRQVRFSL